VIIKWDLFDEVLQPLHPPTCFYPKTIKTSKRKGILR
jgi:hypothetical protein